MSDTIIIPRNLGEYFVEKFKGYQDAGPAYEGWQSDDLREAVEELEIALREGTDS